MKKILFSSIIIVFALIFNACEKSAVSANITGKWNVVNDSVSSSVGIIFYHKNYIGKAGDYFDFKTNDSLYIKEDSVTDTTKYQFISNDKIVIEGYGITDNGVTQPVDITFVNSDYATITISNDGFNNPGGAYKRIINLSR